MTQCWSEGELRAYLDGELPARDMERLAGHVSACADCRSLCAELEGRAARLGGWMEALPNSAAPIRVPAAPARARAGRRWAAAAIGVAATLVIAMALLPKRAPEVVEVPPRASLPHAAVQPPATVNPAILRHGNTPPAPPKPKPQIQYYVALDDEPIETGLVVRVGLNGGQVPADVIVGPDGRPRAIRLASDFSGEAK